MDHKVNKNTSLKTFSMAQLAKCGKEKGLMPPQVRVSIPVKGSNLRCRGKFSVEKEEAKRSWQMYLIFNNIKYNPVESKALMRGMEFIYTTEQQPDNTKWIGCSIQTK